MRMNKKITGGILVFLGTLSHIANASDSSRHVSQQGLYYGLEIGWANLNNKTRLVNTGTPSTCDPLTAGTCVFVKTKPANTGIAERIFIGIKMNPHLGFETGFTNYTSSSYEPKVSFESNKPHIVEYSGDLLLRGRYPITPNIGAFVKLGGAIVYQSLSGALAVDGTGPTSGGSSYLTLDYGVGLTYNLPSNWQCEVSFTEIQKTQKIKNIEFVAVGISYHYPTSERPKRSAVLY